MNLHLYSRDEIRIPTTRQRKEVSADYIQELAASIADTCLIHPITIRRAADTVNELVAGECRMRALEICWNFGQEVRCGNRVIPEGKVPCIYLGEIDPVLAFEIELEENIRRSDLDWKDKARATNALYELRRSQAQRKGTPLPTVADIAVEVSGAPSAAGSAGGDIQNTLRQDLILSQHLQNPVVAGAKSRKEAWKALKRDEETRRNADLGRSVGATFTAAMHTLRKGDCLEVMRELASESFDVILTDPPYGINAQDFGDSDGKAQAHFYDDSPEEWLRLMLQVIPELYRVTKAEAHVYMFCDIDNFLELKDLVGEHFQCFRTPFIWINPTAMRTPWVDGGPQRKWQMVLYARKGNKPVTRIYGDVLTYPSDNNLGHQAQKPVALYADLLRRSIRPGDAVLDPFCGTGTIFSASHELKVRATGIELDDAAYGIAAQRLGGLK